MLTDIRADRARAPWHGCVRRGNRGNRVVGPLTAGCPIITENTRVSLFQGGVAPLEKGHAPLAGCSPYFPAQLENRAPSLDPSRIQADSAHNTREY